MTDKALILPCDVMDVSDGYHTFRELYDHRFALFIALCSMIDQPVYRARLNKDGKGYDGWFVAWIETKQGMISYHLPDKYWGNFEGFSIEKPTCDTYDGHTSQDAIERLLSYARFGE